MNPDLLTISDIGLASGEYWYRVSAYYNLASYGFPGTYDESMTAGPEPVYILTTPTNRIVRNQTLPNAQSHCFDATQFIFVAGNNTSFTIQNGGSATMIAGQSIFYRPTTTVQSGGYLHGYIAPVGPFCPAPAIPAVITSQDEAEMIKGQSTFRIYPNPTTGNFILEKAYDAEMVTVDIFGMWGEKVMTAIIDGERKHEFSLSDKPVGVYFIRVIFGDKAETVKIVKQ